MSQIEPVPVQIEPKRDIWEKIGALSPLMCGVLISAVGTYCTYSYNQQQIKIQQVQTMGSFIPHLMGNEQSKKAAILALYEMTNSQTASKFAQIFASSGTVSALQSMSKNGSEQDKAIANQALNTALQNLAKQDASSKAENDYEKKLIGLKNSGNDNSYTAYNLSKLAQIYTMRGQYDLAEPLLMQSLSIREKQHGADNPQICDNLRSLAEIYFMTGRASKAEANIKRARDIEEKFGLNAGQSLAKDSSSDEQAKSVTPSSNNSANDQSKAAQPETVKTDGNTLGSDETKKDGQDQLDKTKNQLSGSASQG
jgi:tetratricopeptide (TPR) repeat protein